VLERAGVLARSRLTERGTVRRVARNDGGTITPPVDAAGPCRWMRVCARGPTPRTTPNAASTVATPAGSPGGPRAWRRALPRRPNRALVAILSARFAGSSDRAGFPDRTSRRATDDGRLRFRGGRGIGESVSLGLRGRRPPVPHWCPLTAVEEPQWAPAACTAAALESTVEGDGLIAMYAATPAQRRALWYRPAHYATASRGCAVSRDRPGRHPEARRRLVIATTVRARTRLHCRTSRLRSRSLSDTPRTSRRGARVLPRPSSIRTMMARSRTT
jgi:hypothetical protein